jgi:hypothetical protein
VRWLILTGAVAVVAVAVAARALLRRGEPDVGSVSDRWIAEHRANEPQS